jgi:ribonuclease G
MSKEMIVSVNGREKKIAILENGKVTEFYIERGEENAGIAGNIYKGRVQRVLPGMQSAFVNIGLERDAFLYVSDFFDEEEEIERIVMEKGKKVSPEDAKREAQERIERARVEREKQMESAQDIAEPLTDGSESAEALEVVEPQRDEKRGRSRRGRGRDRDDRAEQPVANVAEPPVIEFDDFGFERIVDDEDTGDMFKDAYMQEAIVDKVRAIEFDLESTSVTEVGSLLDSLDTAAGQFERVADEDEATPEPDKKSKSRGRAKKAADGAAKADKPKATKAKSATKPKAKTPRKKKAVDAGVESELPDAEAVVREPSATAEMTVRRGGRGRRRGGRGRKPEGGENGDGELNENLEGGAGEEFASDIAVDPIVEEPIKLAEEPVEIAEVAAGDGTAEPARGRDRGRGRGRDSRDNRDNRDSRDGARRNDRGPRNDRSDRRDRPPTPTISDLLREGQEILVQIAKEPIARKGARITSHIAMPGRFLVYMPTIEHLGVSRKIESASERSRLRTLIQRIRQDEEIPSGGFIVRTAGTGISEEDLRQDARYLVRTWLDVKKNSEKAKSPAMVHQDLDLVQRLLRDQLSDDFTAIRVDSEEEYLRTVEFINRIQPRLVKRVKLYTREEPILDTYGVQEEIDKALKPRVWLKSGGYLVINQTEALVAIDVNTGKFVGKGNARLEDTITRTNMEAVDEIARQIRLRDLGGIIVLDLIDMEDRRNRHKVSQALQEALQSDKSPTKVLSFNDFGLIIMTRKRVKQSLERTMCSPCENCEGAGWVKSATTVCYEILAEARRLSKHLDDVRNTTLRIHPDVAKAFRNGEREVLEEIENYLGNVDITADPHVHQGQFDFAFV